jgi:hypothetical protein
MTPVGPAAWKAQESYYNSLTLAKDGDPFERDVAGRPGLARMFPNYEVFWKRHVCPATTRPHGIDFRANVSSIICLVSQLSYSVLCDLIEAEDSLAKVRAGDFGVRNRNCRDALERAGNALQKTTELQFALCGNPYEPAAPSVAGLLGGIRINPFPDWSTHWKKDREDATAYRHYLTHQGLLYTVLDPATGEKLVMGRTSFKPGALITWKEAEASYKANPGDWRNLALVCEEILADTVAFIDLTYERLVSKLEPLLINPHYQQLWGWHAGPASSPSPTPGGPSVAMASATIPAASGTLTASPPAPSKPIVSSGPCQA